MSTWHWSEVERANERGMRVASPYLRVRSEQIHATMATEIEAGGLLTCVGVRQGLRMVVDKKNGGGWERTSGRVGAGWGAGGWESRRGWFPRLRLFPGIPEAGGNDDGNRRESLAGKEEGKRVGAKGGSGGTDPLEGKFPRLQQPPNGGGTVSDGMATSIH